MNRAKSPRRAFRCLAALVGVTAGLLAAEGIVRLTTNEGFSILIKHPVMGQTYRPDFDGPFFDREARRTTQVRINHEGFRGPSVPRDKPRGVTRVALLGDSFFAGLAVDEEETVAARLQYALNEQIGPTEVLNFAVSGYGSAASLLAWREFARHYQPDVVVLGFFVGNDLADNHPGMSTAFRPGFELDAEGRLQERPMGAARVQVSRWLSNNSALYVWQNHQFRRIRNQLRRSAKTPAPGMVIFDCSPDAKTQEAWLLTEAIIGTLAREVTETGASFLLTSLPAHEQIFDASWQWLTSAVGPEKADDYRRTYPDNRLSSMANAIGVPFQSLTIAFRWSADAEQLFFRSGDERGHWTAPGHRLAAEALSRAIEPLARRELARRDR